MNLMTLTNNQPQTEHFSRFMAVNQSFHNVTTFQLTKSQACHLVFLLHLKIILRSSRTSSHYQMAPHKHNNSPGSQLVTVLIMTFVMSGGSQTSHLFVSFSPGGMTTDGIFSFRHISCN